VARTSPDVIGVQEDAGADRAALATEARDEVAHARTFRPRRAAGYSGVALDSTVRSTRAESSLARPFEPREPPGREDRRAHDRQRLLPNAAARIADNSRVAYKRRNSIAALTRESMRRWPRGRAGSVVMGDFNTAPHEDSIGRGRARHQESGFCERAQGGPTLDRARMWSIRSARSRRAATSLLVVGTALRQGARAREERRRRMNMRSYRPEPAVPEEPRRSTRGEGSDHHAHRAGDRRLRAQLRCSDV